MKVLEAVKKGIVKCKAISLYSKKTGFHIFSSVVHKENPSLLVKSIINEKFGGAEIELVFLGEHHVEKKEYYTQPKQGWVSFGEIVLTPDQARELALKLIIVAESVSPVLEKKEECLKDGR